MEVLMRTLKVKTGGGSSFNFTPGWHTLTATKAQYGEWNGTKYIDVWFQDYPESLNLRVYAKEGQDGEEFAIGRLFRFANAGIMEVAKSDNGEAIVKLNDDATALIGKEMNVFFYKDGDYYRILGNTAPTVFENELESFKESDILYWKSTAEKYYNNYVADNHTNGTTEFVASDNVTNKTTVSTDIPF